MLLHHDKALAELFMALLAFDVTFDFVLYFGSGELLENVFDIAVLGLLVIGFDNPGFCFYPDIQTLAIIDFSM
jgi:hypothetical protein